MTVFEMGSGKSEKYEDDGWQKTDDRQQMADDRSQKADDGCQLSAINKTRKPVLKS